jgi:hypothetical protein
MYEGADERLGGSEPMTSAPNLEARKISERLPVVENHLPSAASAGGDDQQHETLYLCGNKVGGVYSPSP